jgi:hypothetical protein
MTFDSGLALPMRTTVRRGAVQLLEPLLRSNGGFLAAVIPWGGIVRGYTDDEGIELLWTALKGAQPAIAIACGDRVSEPAGTGGFNYVSELELVAYHYSQHAQDLTVGRLEINAAAIANPLLDPGLEWIMERTEELIVGQRAGSTAVVKRIVPTREEELRTIAEFSLFAQRYTVTLSRIINQHRGVTDVMTEFRTKFRTSDMDPDPAPPVLEQQSLTEP